MAGIREELDLCDIPKPFQGAAITLVIGGILAFAFMGFTGVNSGLRKALTFDEPAAEVQEEAPRSSTVFHEKIDEVLARLERDAGN